MAEEVVEETQEEEVQKKYITATFPEKSETYKKYKLLSNVAGMGPTEIVRAGINLKMKSDEFKKAAEMIMEEARELE